LQLFFIIILLMLLNLNNYFDPTYHFLYAESINYKEDKYTKENQLDKEVEKKEPNQNKYKDKNKHKNSIYSSAQLDAFYKSFFSIKQMDIPKIYTTIQNGDTYRFNITNPNGQVQVDETDKDNIFTKQNNDGSWRIEYGEPRIDIYTKDAGILPDKPEQLNNLSKGKIQSWNYSELKDTGYWYKPTDWKNVEVTLIFKLLDSSRSKGEQHAISLVTRSISHSEKYDDDDDDNDDEPPFYCGGSSYHNNISNEGNLRMKKEQYHVNYEFERYADTISVGNIYDKIIGFKGIVYNINNTAVKLESWVDLENDGKGPYKKVHEKIDNGSWGDSMTKCGADTDGQAITWGSPLVIIKANDFKFDICDIEVREIVPPISNN
ncbi:MAG: hypothetical protein R3321_08025, partial [Nitrososphaeraceae archaeon]|nr:hypothetical protein [Nitrososphaeraceae archaeon]